ncbi:CLUMA_CG016550, isoform A [Clunio marinus]|uniref:CLUMA_CG016550, isoform A n=1 Tax=Clunio marinus TaxID=568069 RepID=A0A1J1IX88_9DIPT|nr:CLUMA_CG016550, isoform A [Clunio marinus]
MTTVFKEVKTAIVETFQEISVHGFIFLVKRGTNILERLVWLACISVGVYAIISLGLDTWNRYQTSPTVITMDRNKFSWNTSFPSCKFSLTVCSEKRIDDDKVEAYLNSNIKMFPNETIKANAREFIKRLSTISYETMSDFPLDIDPGFDPDDYLKLLNEFKWRFVPEISSGTSNKLLLAETVTENGICDAVNSNIAFYNSFEYWKSNRWDIVKSNVTVVVHPFDGEIYAQLTNISTAYEVFYHGSMEVPDISKQKHKFPETDYTTVEFLALEILTSEDAKSLKPSQRKCNLENEADELLTSSVYSFNLCRSQCRFRMALKECNCIPFFYRNIDKNGKKYPICGPKGMRCLGNIKGKSFFIKLSHIKMTKSCLVSRKRKIDCNCMPNCDNTNFSIQSIRSRIWFLGANFQWGIIDYPKLQLKRELLFGISDVLVYVGGLGGLFLGDNLTS